MKGFNKLIQEHFGQFTKQVLFYLDIRQWIDFGYGLKFNNSFKSTHLGWIGKKD